MTSTKAEEDGQTARQAGIQTQRPDRSVITVTAASQSVSRCAVSRQHVLAVVGRDDVAVELLPKPHQRRTIRDAAAVGIARDTASAAMKRHSDGNNNDAFMASGINFYSYIVISPIRISDIANSS